MRLREEGAERTAAEEALSFKDTCLRLLDEDLAREDFCLGAVEVLGCDFEVPFAESEPDADDFENASFFVDDRALEEVDSRKYEQTVIVVGAPTNTHWRLKGV